MRRILFLLLAMTLWLPHAASATEAGELVTDAELVIHAVIADPGQASLRDMLSRAHAVMIVPSYVKAGLVFGGAAGSGVLLSHNHESGEWSAPAFYSLASASVGLQIGVSSSEVVMVIMNKRGLRAIINNKVKLGVDLSIAAGPIGVRGEAATTGNLVADIYSYARSRGLFAGISLEGGLLNSNDDYSKDYYGTTVKVEDIVLKQQIGKDRAQALRSLLKSAASTL